MKGKTMGRGAKALAVSLAVGLGLTACNRDYVVGYLYVTNAKSTPGQITEYAIDYASGALTQLGGSPVSAGGNNPITVVAAPNGTVLYVINEGTSTVVEFKIGTGGTITAANTYNVLAGNASASPRAAAIDPAGKFLYVTFLNQGGSTSAGGLVTFPVNADGSLGTPLANSTIGTTSSIPYIPLGHNPVGIAIPATGGFVYVVDQENPLTGSAYGVLLPFAENITTGALTPIGTYAPLTGVAAGTTPSAIAADPSGHFLYVTDEATNQLYGYTLNGTPAAGTPLAMLNSPFTTGLFPLGVTVDPRGTFVYVVNFSSSNIGTYVINGATGALSGAGSNQATATGPNCVTIDPALGIYLYTSNNTDNSVSGEQLDPHTGALKNVPDTQFSSAGQPTCLVAVANGAHATQIVE
jgi:DNA-binding beta-propeller fold protein YncE